MEITKTMEGKENFDLEINLLWQKFLDGDNVSFDRLYSKYIQALFVYGLQFTFDRELVKDCIQDVFIKIYETREQFHHVNNILVYLRIALKNRIINCLKREEIYIKYVDASEFSVIDDTSADRNLEWLEEEQQNRKQIEAILKVLTPQQRKVVQYRFIDELSLEEICMQMKINYQSVLNIQQRAIRKIKKHFFAEK